MPRIARTPPTPLSPKTPTDVANGYGGEGEALGAWSPHGRQKQRRPSGGDVMQTPVIERMVGSERLIKLRESLSNITQTPVRTLHSGKYNIKISNTCWLVRVIMTITYMCVYTSYLQLLPIH